MEFVRIDTVEAKVRFCTPAVNPFSKSVLKKRICDSMAQGVNCLCKVLRGPPEARATDCFVFQASSSDLSASDLRNGYWLEKFWMS